MVLNTIDIKEESQSEIEILIESAWCIVLHNDAVNTFDWVIVNLIRYCGHTNLQAEQCAWFVHNKGKYTVKFGTYEDLEPICSVLCEKGLLAELSQQ